EAAELTTPDETINHLDAVIDGLSSESDSVESGGATARRNTTGSTSSQGLPASSSSGPAPRSESSPTRDQLSRSSREQVSVAAGPAFSQLPGGDAPDGTAPGANSTRRASSSPCGSTRSWSSSTTCAPSTRAPSSRSSAPRQGVRLNINEAVPQQSLTGHTNNKAVPPVASFSPDSQFVFSGSTDGRVHVWSTAEGLGGVCGL
ncbi:hypothetical protein HPB47_018555, partial [Ixodes persulcatus]